MIMENCYAVIVIWDRKNNLQAEKLALTGDRDLKNYINDLLDDTRTLFKIEIEKIVLKRKDE